MPATTLSISDLTFSWPNGAPVFEGVDAVFGCGSTGLVGRNGSGKSTLLRLIAGVLTPDRGSVTVAGRLGYLSQDISLRAQRRVDEVLGIAELRKALHRIESGEAERTDFDQLADRWDIEERALGMLARLGLEHIADSAQRLGRTVGTLSGGETVLLGLVAQLLRDPAVLLLDEPTNNLDLAARQRLYDAVENFSGILLVVSHDRELLDRMSTIAELRDGRLRMFGGNLTDYERIVAAEQEAARATVRDAKGDVRKQYRELVQARIKLDRRARYGAKMAEQKREPKIVMGMRKMAAQESAGKLRNNHIEKLDGAKSALAEAEKQLRDDREIRVELPATQVFPGQEVIDLVDLELACGPVVSLHITGPERIALIGRNGIGKTSLLSVVENAPPRVPWRALPQRLDIFDEDRTVAANVARHAPGATPEQIRTQLARFLFHGSHADVAAAALSGGERLRAALAMILLAEPAPKLLLLDEPTNNLDLPSLAHLTQALRGYRGALVVASHDLPFLRTIGATRWLELTAGGLVEVDPA